MERSTSSLDYSSYLHLLSLKRWRESILNDDFHQAEISARKVAESAEAFWKWIGSIDLAITHLYCGRSQDALHGLDDAVDAFHGRSSLSGLAHAIAAHVLIERGEAATALARATKARQRDTPAQNGLFFAVVALASLGRFDEADALASSASPWRREHCRGEILLTGRDAVGAVDTLKQAESLVASTKEPRDSVNPQVPVWFSLGRALLAAGEDDEARGWFSRIVSSGTHRIDWAILYVRSHSLLETICLRQGKRDEAENYRTRFKTYWPEGVLA